MTPRVRQYVAEEAARYAVTVEAVMSDLRNTSPAVKARHAVMQRLRADGFTLCQIGTWMGRNWATVMYATNPAYKARVIAGQKSRQAAINARQRERYADDPAYRERRKTWSKAHA
jgi:hypothetical protein